MDPETAPADEFDLESPLAKFLLGIAAIFYREPVGEEPEQLPGQLKAEVERLIVEVVPEPAIISLKSREQLAVETIDAAWAALDAGEPEAEDLALTALRYWPDCADGYTLLGVSAGSQLEIALPLFTLAVMAAAEVLGPEGFERFEGQFWDAPETRPFMMALGFLARANRQAGALDAAANHFAEMLRLNPADEQGARYELLGIAMQTGMTEIAGKLIQAYADDESPFFAWAKALFAFQRSGDSDQARLMLRNATAANRHIAEYLVDGSAAPALEGASEPEFEALMYLETMGAAWASTRGAVDWVQRHTVTPAKAPPAKEKRSGPREV